MPIVLLANDGGRVELGAAQKKFVPYVNDVFDGLEDGEIDVTGVSEATLKLVLEFLNMRTERLCPTSKRPIRDKSDLAKNGVDEVFAKWIEAKSNPEAFALLNAADFLRIENLMDLAAVKLARRYLQWTMHEKRGVFGTYDLTPDEEEQLKKEHPWAEEEAELEAELRAHAEAAQRATAGEDGGAGGAGAHA